MNEETPSKNDTDMITIQKANKDGRTPTKMY